jgi:C4-dicarboxylate-specific signal transduction histidine kinase
MRTHEVAVLLADQRMPAMTGLELLARAREEFPRTVRMLITAYCDVATAIDAINRGRVRRYLRKPWDQAELVAALEEALELYEAGAKLRSLELQLIDAEKAYALRVISAGLADELCRPIDPAQSHMLRARDALRLASEALGADAGTICNVGSNLVAAEQHLDQALHSLEHAPPSIPPSQNVRRAPAKTDPEEVLRLALRLIETELGSPVELDVRSVSLVHAGVTELSQVFVNLLAHALERTRQSPSGQPAIKVALFSDEASVVIAITDNATCVEPKLLRGFFDPLELPNRSRRSALGLAAAKAVVDDLTGEIEAINDSSGLTVRVRLPAIVDQAKDDDGPTVVSTIRGLAADPRRRVGDSPA